MNMWNFKKYGHETALLDESGRTVTYDMLAVLAEQMAAVLDKKRLVVCLCSNTAGSVAGYAAVLQSGSVPMLLNERLDKKLLQNLLDIYCPAFLWIPDMLSGYFHGMAGVYSAYGYQLLRTGYEKEYALYQDLALLLTTSGSTGSPKFVRQSYGNIRANTQSIVSYLKLNHLERPVTTLPMNYTYGLSVINTHLAAGATILLTEKGLMQKEFWKFVKEQGATSFGGVPYTYEMLDRLRFYHMDLPALKTMTQAGGRLTPNLHEKFARYAKETGRKFVVMYGQCEATARMGYLPAEKALEKKGSMGIAIPGGKFWLSDGHGAMIDTPHTIGELVYEGANVTLGYAGCGEDLVKADERGGILYTGDMAWHDEEGYYYIAGRRKRFLKIYGNRVNLDEMEQLIKSEFEVDAACAGIDDHMYLFLTGPEEADRIKAYAVSATGLHPSAFKVKIIHEIPKNDAGKVRYSELSQWYG